MGPGESPTIARGSTMETLLGSALRGETGATAIEYGLIGGLIAAVIITAVGLVGTNVLALYQSVAAGIAG
jgi:pilus assembly protein Flp/PilA